MGIAADALQIRVLGPLRISRGDISLDVGPPQRRAVLAVLLSNAGHVISASRLVECVWGETTGNSAQSSLHAHMSRLRKALDPRLIDRHPHGYTINIHPSQFDAETFHHLALTGRARIADGDLHDGRDQLRDALALWRGRAYEQFEDAFWARREIMRLDAERLAALTARIDADLGSQVSNAAVIARASQRRSGRYPRFSNGQSAGPTRAESH